MFFMNNFLYTLLGISISCLAMEMGLIKQGSCGKLILSLFKGAKNVLAFIGEIFLEELSGSPLPDKVIDESLLLTNQEALHLVDVLEGSPYDTIKLTDYHVNNGIATFHFDAVGLAPKYKDCRCDQVTQIVSYKVLHYYMKTRNTQPFVYIQSISKVHVRFSIPLSVSAKKFLEEQLAKRELPVSSSKKETLTETVTISEKESKDINDSRL